MLLEEEKNAKDISYLQSSYIDQMIMAKFGLLLIIQLTFFFSDFFSVSQL